MSHEDEVLTLLSDGKPHFSAEFRDKLQLLEYRRRISELRKRGHQIRSIKVKDLFEHSRPGYILEKN